ncbi:hypothetical protein ERICIV_02232 [Paenibacillus larvae subsp. larvae]|uniref:Uncharacterized protein n=4 Tax=root TaxID=1 RepID=A0A345AVM7_9CAUD|nr:hypothetical protein KMD18_gp04 [Paenibacillus phage Halcyone]YP_010082439.1 hypothetical protein KMD20_gp04 [Paenibacillus phage Unity]AVF26372.1 hypothetical protein ERICIII_02211 [Paenibacillus larvae subsp. larvae]AXF40960.1 hypothetical protein HEATH_4 [Paenibacillus phage Heath]AVF31149.1 hypothetical protein ERICIV_02232 [Paenibacillus larvae subsp. larvae]AXF41050.1 hypothetical protein HALCYONE_4 [Paenibacillus phage Halcyone]AXF42585.1 hypothetical protein UNITY_4 [Paenibacillus 
MINKKEGREVGGPIRWECVLYAISLVSGKPAVIAFLEREGVENDIYIMFKS